MYDRHQRPYHDQQYRNAAENNRGTFLDSVEIPFLDPPYPEQRAWAEEAAQAWAGDRFVTFAWSRPDLGYLEVRAGYYDSDGLVRALAEVQLEVALLQPYYAARMDEMLESGAGSHRF